MKSTSLVLALLLLSCKGGSKDKFTGGDEFNRPKVTSENASSLTETEHKLLFSVGKVNNQGSQEMGSSFYIGKHDGEHLFITNNHVLPKSRDCKKTTITMADTDYSSKVLSCKDVLQTISFKDGSDLTLFSIREKEDFPLSGREVKFANDQPIPGDELVIIGFGSQSDSKRQFNPTISNDSDCVFYDQGRDLKVGSVSVENAFSLGCDTSTGDSGSAIMHKETGEIVAVLFGFTKSKKFIPSSERIHQLIETDPQSLWSHSSLGISIDEVLYRLNL